MKSSTPQTHSALLIPFFDTTPWFFLGKIEYNLQLQWRIMIVRRLRHGLLISMILFLFVKLRSSTLKRHVMCPVVDYLNHAPHQQKKSLGISQGILSEKCFKSKSISWIQGL